MKNHLKKALLIPVSFLLILRAEIDPVPLHLSFVNGDHLKGVALGWDNHKFLFRTSWGQEITVNPTGLKSWRFQQNTFGYTASFGKDSSDWLIDRPRMSVIEWEEGVGTHFESPFSNRLAHILPEGGIPPVQIDMKVDFLENSPGIQIFVTQNPNPNHCRSPYIFFKMHQGNIYCGSLMLDPAVSFRFPIPKDHQGPWMIRMYLDPDANRFRIDLNGKELAAWQEKDRNLASKMKFGKICANLTIKQPVIIEQFEIKMSGGKQAEQTGPLVELANGDNLPLSAVKWDAQGIWIKMPGTDPFAIPSERIVSVTLPPPL